LNGILQQFELDKPDNRSLALGTRTGIMEHLLTNG